jgi:imidazolonepropionase-like amidohydrolase
MKKEHQKTCSMLAVATLCFFLASNVFAQTRPVVGIHENTPNVVALKNAKIVVAPGQVLENATLVVRDGYIEAVGVNVVAPPDAVSKDLSGKMIYAGFIDLFSNYGIQKERPQARTQAQPATPFNPFGGQSSRPATPSAAGPAHWNPAVLAEKSAAEMFKPDEKTAASLRKLGFTAVLTFPDKGIFRGNGALAFLGKGAANEMVYAADLAQGMSFDKNFRSRDYPNSQLGVIALFRQTFLDANWYGKAWKAYKAAPASQDAPEANLALDALQPYAKGQKPVIMEATDHLRILRATRLAKEFNLNMWIVDGGYAYRRVDEIKATGAKLITTLNFPKTPDVGTIEDEANVELHALKHWDIAPENAGRLANAGIDIALTAATLEKKEKFLSNLRTAVKRGLHADKALAALTTTPANWLGMANTLGSLESGKVANFIVTDGNLFADDTKILDTYISGKRYEVTPIPEVDVRGTYTLTISTGDKTATGTLMVEGTAEKPKATLELNGKKVKAKTIAVTGGQVSVSFQGDSLGYAGVVRISGLAENQTLSGRGVLGDGSVFSWNAAFSKPFEEKEKKAKKQDVQMAEFPVVFPEGAFGRSAPPAQPEVVLVKNATIWTSGSDGILENADLLVRKGKIAQIGENIDAPNGAVVVDAKGKHVSAGLIDAHSHIAASGINEGSHAITSEVRIGDVVNGDDIQIYRQLAGGLTMANILHGSANPIGGQIQAIKLRWGAAPEALKFEKAFPGIKFALGENVKRSRSSNNTRYPNTRMGVEQFIRDQFQAAKDYREEWKIYKSGGKKNRYMIPPRRNLRLETLVEIMDDERQIHCHSYRQDEILALIRVADEMGFKVDVFTHILEGYKVADDMKKHGAMASTFSDWWAYKFEVYDAIPFNGALMNEVGLVVSYNSDSAELARRMNTEASKAVKYGGVEEAEALKFVTLNPAKQMRIDKYVGSLEVGKDADFAIWSGSPLSTLSRCEQTWVDGRKYFDLEEDRKLQEEVAHQRAVLVQKILNKKKEPPAGKRPGPRPTTPELR